MDSYIYPNTPDFDGKVEPLAYCGDWIHPSDFMYEAIRRKEITEPGRYIVSATQTNPGRPYLYFFTVSLEKIERLIVH